LASLSSIVKGMKNSLRRLGLIALSCTALTLGVAGFAALSFAPVGATPTANRTLLLSAGYNNIEHSDIIGKVYYPMSEQITGGNTGSYVDAALGGLTGNFTYGKKTEDYYLKWTNLSTSSNSYMMFVFDIHNVLSFDLKYNFEGGRNSESIVSYYPEKHRGGTYQNVTLVDTTQVGEGEIILNTSDNNLSFTPECLVFFINTTTSGTACSFTFESLSISYSC
jgi:hypothetical protein